MSEERGIRKTRIGVVVSDKMDKTVVVSIKTRVRHPLYGKIMNKTSKLKAHDEENACGIGDLSLIHIYMCIRDRCLWIAISACRVQAAC